MSVSRCDAANRLIRAAFIFALARSASFVVVPRDFAEMQQRERATGDRRLIVESVANYRNLREQFSKAIPCIESFFAKYIGNERSRSVLLVLDDEKGVYEVAESLMTSAKSRFAFFARTPDIDIETSALRRDVATNAIVLMSNGNSLEESFHVLRPCDRGCSYVAILVNEFENEEYFLADADVLVRSMWTRRISILAILAVIRDSIFVAGSPAFESNETCFPSPSVILDKCDGDDWKYFKRIDPPALNDCILRLAYFEQPPYVSAINDSENLLGFEGSLIEELTKEFRVERRKVEWNDETANSSYAEQMQILLFSDVAPADLVIGRVLQQSHENIGYSTTYDMLKLVWLVPKVPNVSLQGLIRPFHPYVWLGIAATLLLGCLVKTFFMRDVSWLDVFALIIGVAVARQPTRLSRKIHFISWSIFGLFLAQVYVDSLADQLINVSDLQFETMKDLVSSSFDIGGTAAFASIFDKFEQTDAIVGRIREKLVIFDQNEYAKRFDDLLEGRNNSFALVVVLNSSRSDAIETAHAYTLTTDVICSFPIALATWKGFPYLRDIDSRIHDLVNSGIFNFMIDLATAKQTRSNMFAIAEDKEYKSDLHLQQFVPAFLLMLIGFTSGFIFLILEIVLYPWKLESSF